jgi:hypothetical protein
MRHPTVCLTTLCLAAPLFAAPVPKVKGDPVDLRKLHDRIAEAVAKDNWDDDDAKMVEGRVTALLAKMSKAAEVEEWKLPVAFKGLDKKPAGDVKAVTRDALIVGENLNATGCRNCVIVASGHVHASSLSNCVVVARTVDCTLADNTVVIADEYAKATNWGLPKRGGCVVVAGKRIRATGVIGGLFHVHAPDLTCNAGEEGQADPKDLRPVITVIGSKATFLVDPAAPAMGDKECKRVELKSPIAK